MTAQISVSAALSMLMAAAIANVEARLREEENAAPIPVDGMPDD